MQTRMRVILTLSLMILAFAGCAGPEARLPQRPFQGEAPRLSPETIVDLHTGRALSFDELMGALEKVRVVYVGEVHDRAADHEVQRRIIQRLWERGRRIGVGLEMLPHTAQEVLDRWGDTDMEEAAFLEAVDWEGNWGFPFSLYRPIFALAREKRLPMRALNAPANIVRKVSRQGLSSLGVEERGAIARHFFMDDAAHREYIQKEYATHVSGGIRDFTSFYEAQLVWDETMAEKVAVWLVQEPLDHVVVLAGKGHVNQRFGIPERVRRRIEHRYAIVVPVAVNEAPEQVTAEVGDFLVVTAPEKPFPGHGRRLGVRLEKDPGGEGLRVLEVVPGSRADQAGFRPGDIIRAANGETVRELETLHRLFQESAAEVVFTVERDKSTFEVTVAFEE